MPTPATHADWRSEFLAARGLDRPDGRPLHAYRCTEAEFDALQRTVRERLAARPAPVGPLTAQTFGLWAAEHWRRCYREGAWSWEQLLAADAEYLAPGGPHYPHLQHMVADGLGRCSS